MSSAADRPPQINAEPRSRHSWYDRIYRIRQPSWAFPAYTNIAFPVRIRFFGAISLERNAHKLNDAATRLEMSSPLVARDHAHALLIKVAAGKTNFPMQGPFVVAAASAYCPWNARGRMPG